MPSATIKDYKADVSALATQASVDTIDGIVDQILLDTTAILVDTGTTLPAEHALLATAANLATLDGKVDTVDTVVDAIKLVTDALPDAGALTTIDANIDAILVDTGTTLPGEHALLAPAASIAALNDLSSADVATELAIYDGPTRAEATSDKNEILSETGPILVDTGTTLPAQITALNDLSSTDVQTVIEDNDLDHLLKIAHPSGDPVADSVMDLVMNKDAGQTFDRSTDSLEALRDENYDGPTLQQIIDGVWDELVSAHTDAGSFG